MYKAVIFGLKGHTLTREEREFFAEHRPIGFILFSRNIQNKKQVAELADDLRCTIGNKNAPILIDQEGGRVARLKEPNWYHPPAAEVFGKIALQNMTDAKRACYLNAQILAYDLKTLGINVDCAPLIDVPIPGANNVIGDRAFSDNVQTIVELAKSMREGLNAQGVIEIIKHIPGHGRALVDSHFDLPVVQDKLSILEKTDFVPFIKLNDSKWAMTAHIIYESIDPNNSATHSPKVIKLIREYIGFEGIIITDCITMKALKGTPEINAEKSFAAGCDLVLFSKPDIEEMTSITKIAPILDLRQLSLIEFQPEISELMNQDTIEELFSILDKYKITTTGKIQHDPTERHF